MSFLVEAWDEQHTRWNELLEVVETLHQSSWVSASFAWHRSSHMLVARKDGTISGFLRFVVQPIGLEDDHAPIVFDNNELTEAKILAFGVVPACLRQSIGRTLQRQAAQRAYQLGCYQVRSHSSGHNSANHHLKLAMGFGVHPDVRCTTVSRAWSQQCVPCERATPSTLDHSRVRGQAGPAVAARPPHPLAHASTPQDTGPLERGGADECLLGQWPVARSSLTVSSNTQALRRQQKERLAVRGDGRARL